MLDGKSRLRYNRKSYRGKSREKRKKEKKEKKLNQENDYEKNLSTQEKTKKQGTRIPQKNGNDGGKKGVETPQSKRQKEIDALSDAFAFDLAIYASEIADSFPFSSKERICVFCQVRKNAIL